MRVLGLMAALMAVRLLAQKIETQRQDPSVVVRVETFKDHLTVIEVSEPVTMVAVGNRNAFSIERRHNKVFVTPSEDGVRTNLFIWTSSGRFTYELVPAKDVEQAHFVIEQVAAAPVAGAVEDESIPAGEMMLQSQPVTVAGEREVNGRVEVTLREIYRKKNRLFIRYSFTNHSGVGYQAVRPSVSRLDDAAAQLSLIPLGDRQLGEKAVRTLKFATEAAVDILHADQCESVAADGHGLGWLVVPDYAAPDATSVLKLRFAADSRGPVEAYLVLPSSVSEAARVRPVVE